MALLENTMQAISNIKKQKLESTQKKLDNLTKPQGSLGRLEELAKTIAGITGNSNPVIKNKVIFTLAADHGVTEEKVSVYPKEVTAQMVYNFLRGGAGINVLAKHVGARVVVADFGVAAELGAHTGLIIKKIGYGTKNMSVGPAMARNQAIQCIESGIELFNAESTKGLDIAGTGEMGIGNTTAASAMATVFTGIKPEELTGRGAGLNDEALRNKIEVIKKSININKPDPYDPIEVLAKVGGFEIGGLAGIILAAASSKIPVVIDGFISGAAALLAYRLEPKTKDYMIASHCSVEIGHKAILEELGLKPLLDLDLRLGEGTGAALGISLAEASIKILTEMATFESAKVSQKKK